MAFSISLKSSLPALKRFEKKSDGEEEEGEAE
jgi:hypothetical protein